MIVHRNGSMHVDLESTDARTGKPRMLTMPLEIYLLHVRETRTIEGLRAAYIAGADELREPPAMAAAGVGA